MVRTYTPKVKMYTDLTNETAIEEELMFSRLQLNIIFLYQHLEEELWKVKD